MSQEMAEMSQEMVEGVVDNNGKEEKNQNKRSRAKSPLPLSMQPQAKSSKNDDSENDIPSPEETFGLLKTLHQNQDVILKKIESVKRETIKNKDRLGTAEKRVENMERNINSLVLVIEGIPEAQKDPKRCLSEIINGLMHAKDFSASSDLSKVNLVSKDHKNKIFATFIRETKLKYILDNAKNLKGKKYRGNVISISRQLTLKQQTEKKAAMATKEAFELAANAFPELLQDYKKYKKDGRVQLTTVVFNMLALKNEKCAHYSTYKSKIMTLTKHLKREHLVTTEQYIKTMEKINQFEDQLKKYEY